MTRLFLLLVPMLLVVPANAQTFGELSVTGTACERDAASLVESRVALTILFEGFNVAGVGANAPFFRGACNVALPVDVPKGMSVAVAGTGYRLDAALADGTAAILSVEGFLAGQAGPVLTRSLSGPKTATFVGASVIPRQDLQWSACGTDVIVRANISIRVTSPSAALRAVFDQLRIRLAYRPC